VERLLKEGKIIKENKAHTSLERAKIIGKI